jgi:hypothetical protein
LTSVSRRGLGGLRNPHKEIAEYDNELGHGGVFESTFHHKGWVNNGDTLEKVSGFCGFFVSQ